MFSSSLYLVRVISSWFIISYAYSKLSAISAMSSANAKMPTNSLSTLIPNSLCSKVLMICLISKLNSIGDVLAPCLTPFQFSTVYYGIQFIIQVVLSLMYIYQSSFTISFGALSPISSQNISIYLAESKAFFKSMNITTYLLFNFFCISNISYRLFICSVVDLCGVNPYCYNWYASCCSKCLFSLDQIHLSSTFSNMCLRDMGLQLLALFLSPSLYSKITFDSFSIVAYSQFLSFQICLIIWYIS